MKKFIALLMLSFWCSTAFAQKVPSVTGSKVSQADAQEALDFHNKVRKDVGSKPLEWSEALAAYAQNWADSLALRDCAMEHRPYVYGEVNYGENIFWGIGLDYTPRDASNSWYNEIKEYVYEPIGRSNWHRTGHYSQMVWSRSEKVGIGMAVCSSGAILIVANYDPAGNTMGQKPY